MDRKPISIWQLIEKIAAVFEVDGARRNRKCPRTALSWTPIVADTKAFSREKKNVAWYELPNRPNEKNFLLSSRWPKRFLSALSDTTARIRRGMRL